MTSTRKHMDSPLPESLTHGRTNQKLRTRNALLDAARMLITKGAAPTVEDAAEAASISRTTAYRYFKNQAELLAAAHPETQATTLLPENAPEDPEARLDLAVRELLRQILAGEPQYRTMLRLSLDGATSRDALPLRQGRAIRWYEEALEPARAELGKAAFRRLVLAVRATTGIESLVWLVDVGGLSREEAVKTMRWSARALLRASLAERG